MENIKWEDTEEFVPPLEEGKDYYVIKVYDGDTITIVAKFDWSPKYYRFGVRLRGINAPEIKSKTAGAQDAREFLSNLVLHKYVKLSQINTEKYGRILAHVHTNNETTNETISVSQILLNNNLVKPFMV